jgi:ribosome maturation factor RimP
MILKEDIEKLAEEFLDGTDKFIVKLNVGSDNRISIYIDGDKGVTIDDCVGLSRFIENQYDRETEDYELNVSSAGVDQPFINLRQYLKYIERPVEVFLNDGSKKRGILQKANENEILIALEKKSNNKKAKKMIAGELLTIPMQDVAQTKAFIVF